MGARKYLALNECAPLFTLAHIRRFTLSKLRQMGRKELEMRFPGWMLQRRPRRQMPLEDRDNFKQRTAEVEYKNAHRYPKAGGVGNGGIFKDGEPLRRSCSTGNCSTELDEEE